MKVLCKPLTVIQPTTQQEYGKQTSGRCIKCNIRFIWNGKPKLSDAYCPICGIKLTQTTHMFQGLTRQASTKKVS